MTEFERMHTTESAEGDEPGDEETGGRTPHSEQPAEGSDTEDAEDAEDTGTDGPDA